MTYEELLERINELEKENISLKNQLREQANKRVTSNDDFRYEYIDDDYEENNEDIGFEPIVASPVTEVSSKSENSSVSESKVDERNFGSELRKRLFPWLRKKNLSTISNNLDNDNNQIDDEELVDINQSADTGKKDSDSEEEISVEENLVDLSDLTFSEDEADEVVDINQFADAGKKDSNSEEELSAEETPVDLSDFSFVDINDDEENLENNEERENAGEEEFTGYVFADEDTNENEEEDNKKRRFPFFGKKKEKIDYQPKHLRQTKKLETYVMRDDSEVPSTTAANEFGVSSTEVVDSLDKSNKDNDKKTQSNSNSKEDMSSATTSGSNEQKNDQEEYNAPELNNDEVEYNNDLNTDYTIVDDGYGVEIDYDIGDDVHFDGPYLYKTSVDAANDTNRYNPLYPSTDERKISLIRLVSPDGSEKITIDTNNKEKKEQLESQGWTVESYNINNLTNGVIHEGWTPGKSLK